jgi:polyphosphate kinase 2 (PPK2 family)
MLDQIDLDRRISKEEYRQRLPTLQARLNAFEQLLLEVRVPVVLVFEGWAGTSKIGAIGVLMRRLDPRGLRVHSITPARTSESQYPWLHRFWLKTPSYGQIAIFDRSWYREVLAARTQGSLDEAAWRERCEDIVSFERQLADDGAVTVKFWLHISRKEQRRRFRRLEAHRVTRWQVTDEDHWQQKHFKRVQAAVEDLLTRTDAPYAPWIVLPATDQRYAQIAMLETVIDALSRRLGLPPETQLATNESDDDSGSAFRRQIDLLHGAAGISALPPTMPGSLAPDDPAEVDLPPQGTNPAFPVPAVGALSPIATARPAPIAALPLRHASPGILARVDLAQRIEPEDYDRVLARLQAKLHLLGFQVYLHKRPVIVVFEGWDAAGKGGAIHRVTAEIDPRSYVVHPIAAPAGDDKAHHYLYRFWRRLPPRGQIAIFDRSWYGRVLVERVEGLARADEWQRAYAEINEFERQLVAFGTVVCKFWLQISPEEQLRRFEERQTSPFKGWKLTDEDWRNRAKWPLYEAAADEMLLRTATPAAPWTIVESEDKRFGRVKILRTVVSKLEDALGKVSL